MTILTRETATCVRMHIDLSRRIDSFINEVNEWGIKKYTSKAEFVAIACMKLMEEEATKRRKEESARELVAEVANN
jgi:hypothetical protein